MERKNRLGCIYRISIGEKFIIGSTINFKNRVYNHLYLLKNNKHDNAYLQKVYKNNPNPKFEILQDGIPEKILKFSEDVWIGATCSKLCDKNNGMNIIDGSRIVFTEEILNKKSQIQKRIMASKTKEEKQLMIEKIIRSKKDKFLDIGKAISKAKKGKNTGWENNQSFPVVQKTRSGDVIEIWASAYQASLQKPFNSAHIINVCKKRKGYKTHKGFLWEFATDEQIENRKGRNNSKPKK